MLAAPLSAQSLDWGQYRNPDYGYQIDIPYSLFAPVADVEGKLSFEGIDGANRLTIYGEENTDQLTLAQVADELSKSPSISEVTYRKEGASWIVLSGYFRPDGAEEQIFYLKLMMSADRRTYAVFAINYPESEKARFDPVVERLEASFRRPS